MLAHNVYFTLKDSSEASIQKLVTACKTYLVSHPGVVFFACGTLEPELARPVNVRDYHVALHMVFDSRASHDLYQEAPLHKQFIEENRDNWATVRIYDSVVESA